MRLVKLMTIMYDEVGLETKKTLIEVLNDPNLKKLKKRSVGISIHNPSIGTIDGDDTNQFYSIV